MTNTVSVLENELNAINGQLSEIDRTRDVLTSTRDVLSEAIVRLKGGATASVNLAQAAVAALPSSDTTTAKHSARVAVAKATKTKRPATVRTFVRGALRTAGVNGVTRADIVAHVAKKAPKIKTHSVDTALYSMRKDSQVGYDGKRYFSKPLQTSKPSAESTNKYAETAHKPTKAPASRFVSPNN